MRRRSGFTLVEVLVAMALILFIMTILAAAFASATQTVSDFKAAGDLAERLRGAATVLKRDLEADHFTDGFASSPRLSSPTFWNRLNDPINNPPLGFFRIFQGQADQSEGFDLDNLPSYYQTTAALHYTITLHGVRRGDFLSAVVPAASPLTTPQAPPSTSDNLLGPPDERYQDTPNEYNSQLAEVVLFLAPNGDQTDGTAGPAMPLFTLCRRQFLAVPTGWTSPPAIGAPAPPAASQAPGFIEVSTNPAAPETAALTNAGGNLTFNDLKALAMPVRRFSIDRANAAGALGSYLPTAGQYATMGQSNAAFQSADLLVSDVVSFDVRMLIAGAPDFVDLFDSSLIPYSGLNPAFIGANPRVFDTWSNQLDALTGTDYSQWNGPWQTPALLPATNATVPLYKNPGNGQTISIQAIQITLRVWDFKTKKTRQVTIVQQM